MKWGIIGAMESEITALLGAMKDIREVTVAGNLYYDGVIGDTAVTLTRSGIGKVCAAMAAQVLVDRFAVDALLNTGVAGGVDRSLCVGDIVLARDAVQHDFDISPFGHVRGYMFGDNDQEPTRFAADAVLCERFHAAAQSLPNGAWKILDGTVASGDVFVDSVEQKDILRDTYGAAAAEMEGAAVAQVACANGVPFLIVRAISDLADGSAPVSFDTFVGEAADRSAKLVLALLAG